MLVKMFQYDLRRFDVYRKIPKDLTQPTRTGAVISLVATSFCLFLLLFEFSLYLKTDIKSTVYVDDPIKFSEFLPVYLSISLPKMPCLRLGLDAQDNMGRHEVGLIANTKKHDLPGGGCLMECSFRIAKVSGNFHVSTHAYDESLRPEEKQSQSPVNLVHTINELTFGNGVHSELRNAFEEVSSFAPLDNHTVGNSQDWDSHEYFLKIVPSIFDSTEYRMYPYQFTSFYRKKSGHREGSLDTGIWFRYEMAPIVVKYREIKKPLYHFLTQVCAIIGGTFTVSSMIDSMLFTASQMFYKAEIGKLP